MAREVAGQCNYCSAPVDPNAGWQGCSFHSDWEAACNLAEDDCGGSTPRAVVVGYMHEWGWSPDGISAGLARESGEDDDSGAESEHEAERATHCEDFPCCGHESGDCFGQKYGSDASIKAAVYARMDDDDWDTGLGEIDGGGE